MFEKNNPYKCIKPECIDTSVWYSISFNPDDNHQYFNEEYILQRLKKFNQYWNVTFNKYLNNTCYYKLQMEISSRGRLHYHGRINIVNIISFICALRMISLHGTYEIDTIKDKEIWDNYCVKQSKLFDKIYEIHNMPEQIGFDKYPEYF